MKSLFALVALAPALALAAPPNRFDAFAHAAPRVGERLPTFTLKDTTGKEVKLPSGKPTVLVFGSFS